VRLGIDVLEDSNFLLVRGRRIALLTHPAGVDRRGTPTVDVLRRAPGVKLVALFATEHGIWNNVPAGKFFSDTRDPKTGLPVFSLYDGKNTHHVPTGAQLKGIDALVIDLQDVGVRSYTFSGTMKRAMEGCFQHNVEVIILDRPNPLGGIKVSGPMLDPALVGASLVCEFPVPYVHGLTMGELARLAKGTPGVLQINPAQTAKGRLTVVSMAGWRRTMRWTETGLGWVPTSPAITDFASVMGYAMTGLGCELGGFKHGVGSQYLFRGISNQLVRPEVLARELHALRLPGINFRQISAPSARSAQPGTGLYIEVNDWDDWRPADLSFYLMRLACKLEPRNPFVNVSKSDTSRFLHEVGCAALFHDLATQGARIDIEGFLRQWDAQDRQYREASRRFWLYQ
jgi:uncharacterized protein YbbC (DUF1343 family)